MYKFQGITFGPTEVTVKDDTLRGALDQMGQLYNLHKDALFLAAHVEFFHDVEPEVVPRSRDDDEGYQYRGFECLRTGCSVTFKEKEEKDGIFPGRFAAYRNGDDNPKLYDPKYEPGKILEMVDTDTPFIRKFGVNIGANGQHQSAPAHGHGQKPEGSKSAANPSEMPEASATKSSAERKKHESEEMYDTNGTPSAKQAAQILAQKAQQEYESSEVAGEVTLQGDPLSQKLRGLVEYAGRDHGYASRILDALGLSGFDQVAVGKLGDVTKMILDEDTLRQNESFEPDDDLPF